MVTWDEYFLTLDDTDASPQRGFDQNRLFVGVAAIDLAHLPPDQ